MNLWSGQLYKSLFLDNNFTRKLNITVKSRIKNSLQWTRNNEIPPPRISERFGSEARNQISYSLSINITQLLFRKSTVSHLHRVKSEWLTLGHLPTTQSQLLQLLGC
jgi:hypothetical protein